MAEPDVEASLTARELNAYGELWGDLSADASLAGSRLELTNLDLQKPQTDGEGSLSGSLAYDLETQAYSVDLTSRDLRVSSLELPSGEAVKGAFDIQARGEGSLAEPQLEASIGASGLVVGEQELGDLNAKASVADGAGVIDVQAPKFKLDAHAESRLEAPYPASFRAAISNLDLSTLGIEPRQGQVLEGAITGVVEGSGEIENWQDGTITANFEQAQVGTGGVKLRNDGPWKLSVRDRRLFLDSFSVLSGKSQFKVEGEMPFDASQPEGELRVVGAFNLEVVPAMLAKSVDEAFVLGILNVTGAVRGSFEKVEPDVDLKLEDGVVFTPETLYPIVNIQMDAHVDSSRVELSKLTAEYSKGMIEATGSVPFGVIVAGEDLPIEVNPADGGAQFHASLSGLDLDELNVIPDGGGRISLDVEASAPKLEIEAVSAKLTAPELALQVRDLKITEAEPVEIVVENGALRVASLHLTGPRTDLTVTGGAELTGDRNAKLQVNGAADAGIVGYLMEDLRMSGPAELHASVTGPLTDPAVEGTFTLREATFSLDSPRLDSERLDMALRFDSERLEIEQLEGSLNGGRLKATGGLAYKDGIHDVDVEISAQGVFLDFPEGMRTLSDTDLQFHSVEDNLVRLDGKVSIEDGSFRERLDVESQVMTFLNGGGALDFVQEPDPFLSRVRYNVAVESKNPVVVDNNLAKLEATVDLRFVGTYYRPSLLGRVILEEGGEVTLAENRYVIENGLVEFTSEARIRPSLNLQARTQVAGYDIILRATGSGDDIKTDFTSEPTLPEPDVISLLLTGRTLEQARESGLNIAREQALSYLTGSLGGRIGSAAQQSLGLTEVRIEPNLISAEGDPSARLTIGQQITRQLNLIYSMNLTDSGDQIFVTEYDVTRRFQTKAVKQSDNTYRFDFRHDLRWGLEDAPHRGRRSGPQIRVGEVDFEGDLKMDRDKALDILDVKPGAKYDFFKSRRKVDKLTETYYSMNRHEARVRVDRDKHDDTIDLHYDVRPGPQIEFTFQPADVPGGVRKKVEQAWNRGVFDLQRQDDAKNVLLEWLYADGYLQAEVESEIAIVDDDHERAQFLVRRGVKFSNVQLVFEGAKGIATDDLELVLERTNLRDRLKAEPREVADRLKRYYYQRGYLNAEVERPRFDLEPDTATGKVIIAIKEGPLFEIGKLSFPTVKAVTEEEARAAVEPAIGTPYTPEYLEEALRKLEDLYWQKGYNDVLVNFQLTRREEAARVDITFDITENNKDVVEQIEVAGNQNVSDKLIRRRLVSKKGGLLLSANNDLTRRRLYDTGAFSLVDLETAKLENVDAPPGVNPLRLTARVREATPYRLRYGAYFDTDRGPGAISDFEAKNVIGSARSVGGRLRYDNDFREVRAYFNQPLMLGFPLKTTAATFRSREILTDFLVDRTGVSVQQEVEMGREYLLQYGYRFVRTHTFEKAPNDFLPLDITTNVAPLTATFTHDSRDEILDATRGNFYSHGFEFAPAKLGSQLLYWRYFGQYFRYKGFFKPDATPFDEKPPRAKVVWAGGARVGFSNGLQGQDIIKAERFFAGGGTTVRGFKQNELGPKDFFGDPDGGEAVFILNQELRFPLVSIFEGVGFVDLGNVYSRWDDFNPTDVRSAGGFGLRVRTPYFLIRADYGFKLDRKPGESLGAFFFSIGQAF
ncbi:MAG: translocation/assembly module TamB domain-containing protein [Bryobacterales bacterium]